MKFDDGLEKLSRYEIRRSIELLNQRVRDVRAEIQQKNTELQNKRAELEDLTAQRKILINHRNALRDAAND